MLTDSMFFFWKASLTPGFLGGFPGVCPGFSRGFPGVSRGFPRVFPGFYREINHTTSPKLYRFYYPHWLSRHSKRRFFCLVKTLVLKFAQEKVTKNHLICVKHEEKKL